MFDKRILILPLMVCRKIQIPRDQTSRYFPQLEKRQYGKKTFQNILLMGVYVFSLPMKNTDNDLPLFLARSGIKCLSSAR